MKRHLICAALCAAAIPLITCESVAQTAKKSAIPPKYVWRNVVTGGGGGFVDGIVFHPKQRGLIYCRTDIGGAYRWNPATSLWVPLTDWVGQDNGNLRGAESIAVDPTDPNRVYVAAGTYMQADAPTAILSSDDQGRTWKQTPMPGVEMGGNADGRNIGERLAVDPNKPNVIYFGSREAGLWKSTDYAASFNQVASFPSIPNDAPPPPGQWRPPTHAGIGWVVFDTHSGKPGQPTPRIYAGVAALDAPAQVYVSTDSGASWSVLAGQPTGLIPQHAGVDKTGTLYIDYTDALGPNGASTGAVWKYDPSSSAWTNISPEKALGLNQAGGYGGMAVDYDRVGIVTVATLDHWGPSDNVYRTLDGGKTWVAVEANAKMVPTGAPWLNWGNASPKFGWWIAALASDPFDPAHVLYGTGATIWGTQDISPAEHGQPTTWVCNGNGIEETAVTALAVPSAGPWLLSGLGDIGGFVHTDLNVSPPSGMSSNPIFGSTSSVDVAGQAPNVMVRAGASNSKQYGAISTDSGATWNPFPTLPPGARGGGAIAVTADGKTVLWRPQGGQVSYTTDGGQTWQVPQGLTQSSDSSNDYFGQGRVFITADRVDPSLVYVTGVSGQSLYVSHDGGKTFAPATGTGLPANSRLNLVASFDKPGDLWAQQGNDGLYRSTDSGATFTKIPTVGVADGIAVGKAAPGHTNPALYLIGDMAGSSTHAVFRSDDDGQSWTRINDDQHQYGWIGKPLAADLRVYGRVYVGTNGRGIIYGEPASNAPGD